MNQIAKIPFYQKLIPCTLAGLTGGATVLRIGRLFLVKWIPEPVVLFSAVLFAAVAVLYAIFWHFKENRQAIHSLKTLAFWQGLVCFCMALDLSLFGWQKLFRMQFFTPLGMLDVPFSEFTGEWLTWSYFGYSYPMTATVGFFQIAGASLLVFTRTRLLAVFISVPVMLNILLIDIYYNMPIGVTIHALINVLGLAYLMWVDRDHLLQFFLMRTKKLSVFQTDNLKLKSAIRFSILAVPLLLIAMHEKPIKYPELRGKYAVTKISVNGKDMTAASCTDRVLTVIYLDIKDEAVFEFQNYKQRWFGIWSFNPGSSQLNVKWLPPFEHAGNVMTKFSIPDKDNKVTMSGKFGADDIIAELVKER